MPVYNCGRKTGHSNSSTLCCLRNPSNPQGPPKCSHQARGPGTRRKPAKLHSETVGNEAEEWCLRCYGHRTPALCLSPHHRNSFCWRYHESLQPAAGSFLPPLVSGCPKAKGPSCPQDWGSGRGEWPIDCPLTISLPN